MAPNVQKFCSQLVKHQLISAKDLEKYYRHWRTSAPTDRENLTSFAGYLVSHGGVTEAKLQALAAGGVAPAQSGEPEFDVELVPVPGPRKLNRRDLAFLGGGLVSGAGIAFFIAYIARLREVPRPGG